MLTVTYVSGIMLLACNLPSEACQMYTSTHLVTEWLHLPEQAHNWLMDLAINLAHWCEMWS